MIGNNLSGDGGGDVVFALTGGDVLCISIHICVIKGGELITGDNLHLEFRLFCTGEAVFGGRNFAGGSLARKGYSA